ncbi:MAG: dihydroorotate dehydrogenase, partial [Anaerolineaceae bacterium]
MVKVDLSCDFLSLKLHNPIVLASGVIGTSETLLQRAAECGAGAVTAKSCGPVPRAGHPNPVALDWGEGVINAIGLTNPGVQVEIEMLKAS